MADGIEFKLTGDKELDAKFAALPIKLQGKVLRPALRDAAKVILPQAQENIHSVSGTFAGSLKVRAGKRTRKGTVSVVVQTAAGFFKGKAFYGGFVELGHRQGSRKLGDKRKFIPGQHPILRAAQARGDEAKNVALAKIRAGILETAS